MTYSEMQSKMGSALGVPLSKLRGSGTQIGSSATRSAALKQLMNSQYGVFNNDAASLYPSSFSQTMSDRLKSVGGFSWTVNESYPFVVERIDHNAHPEKDGVVKIITRTELSFDRRLDAEKKRLELLVEVNPDMDYQTELDNIEDEYPEWLI